MREYGRLPYRGAARRSSAARQGEKRRGEERQNEERCEEIDAPWRNYEHGSPV